MSSYKKKYNQTISSDISYHLMHFHLLAWGQKKKRSIVRLSAKIFSLNTFDNYLIEITVIFVLCYNIRSLVIAVSTGSESTSSYFQKRVIQPRTPFFVKFYGFFRISTSLYRQKKLALQNLCVKFAISDNFAYKALNTKFIAIACS